MRISTIYSNVGDEDTKHLPQAWAGLPGVSLMEINDKTQSKDHKKIEEFISAADDTLLLIGHGLPEGLLGLVDEDGFCIWDFVFTSADLKHIKARKVVCIWCFASSFCRANHLDSLSSSMFISSTLEATLNGITNVSQEDINEVDIRFYSQLRDLMASDKSMEQWARELRANVVPETHPAYAVDKFNRDGICLIVNGEEVQQSYYTETT